MAEGIYFRRRPGKSDPLAPPCLVLAVRNDSQATAAVRFAGDTVMLLPPGGCRELDTPIGLEAWDGLTAERAGIWVLGLERGAAPEWRELPQGERHPYCRCSERVDLAEPIRSEDNPPLMVIGYLRGCPVEGHRPDRLLIYGVRASP